jgi:hypothetical protein
MGDTPEKGVSGKKVYDPPRVIRVSLRPEEAVLGHCKFLGVAGPASASCSSLACKSLGS